MSFDLDVISNFVSTLMTFYSSVTISQTWTYWNNQTWNVTKPQFTDFTEATRFYQFDKHCIALISTETSAYRLFMLRMKMDQPLVHHAGQVRLLTTSPTFANIHFNFGLPIYNTKECKLRHALCHTGSEILIPDISLELKYRPMRHWYKYENNL